MAAESAIGSVGLEVAAWVVTYALHSTVLLLAALVAFAWIGHAAKTSQCIADAAPAWRECIGKVALLAGIVTASVQTALGIQPFGLRPALVEVSADHAASASDDAPVSSATRAIATEPSASPTTSALVNDADLPLLPSWPAIPLTFVPIVAALNLASELPLGPMESAPAVQVSTGTLAESVVDPKPTSTPRIATVLAALFAVWAVVACAAALRRLAGWRALQRSLADSARVTDSGVLAQFDELCRRAGVRSMVVGDARERETGARAAHMRDASVRDTRGVRVELRVAPLLASPMSRGFLRPEVCVPPRALRDLDADELAALLGHELAHVARRDPAWLVVFRVIEVVFCLQPLNRIVARRLEDDAELLCDDRAVVWTGERIPLASCLTEVASWLVPAGRAPRLAVGMAAHGARLSRRVERLVDDGHSPDAGARRPLSTAAAIAFAGVSIAIVPGFAGQSSKPLPLDLQHDLQLETALAVRSAESFAAPNDVIDTPSIAVDASAEECADEPVDGPDDASADIEPLVFPFAPSPVALPAVDSPLDAVLQELDLEMAQLRANLSTREGGASLAVDLDALAARIEALRARAARLTTLLASQPNILLSPDVDGRSAEDHNP